LSNVGVFATNNGFSFVFEPTPTPSRMHRSKLFFNDITIPEI